MNSSAATGSRLGRTSPAGDQRLHLGGEGQPGLGLGQVERLLPHPVAGQHQPPPRPVPERDREHAAQVLDEARPVLLVEVDDRLAVAAGGEAVATPFEFGAQLAEVVDLTVEDSRHLAVLADHRLRAASRIDDAEPAHAEGHARLEQVAVLVGATVLDRRGHRPQRLGLERGAPRVGGGNAGDSAHPGLLRARQRGPHAAAQLASHEALELRVVDARAPAAPPPAGSRRRRRGRRCPAAASAARP